MSVGQIVASSAVLEVRRRHEYLAPLFGYLRSHFFIAGLVAQEAGRRRGQSLTAVRVAIIKRGEQVIFPWFVAECCAVIGKSVEEVMGAEWVARFGESGDGEGGSEIAPVGIPRTYRKDAVKGGDQAESSSENAA